MQRDHHHSSNCNNGNNNTTTTTTPTTTPTTTTDVSSSMASLDGSQGSISKTKKTKKQAVGSPTRFMTFFSSNSTSKTRTPAKSLSSIPPDGLRSLMMASSMAAATTSKTTAATTATTTATSSNTPPYTTTKAATFAPGAQATTTPASLETTSSSSSFAFPYGLTTTPSVTGSAQSTPSSMPRFTSSVPTPPDLRNVSSPSASTSPFTYNINTATTPTTAQSPRITHNPYTFSSPHHDDEDDDEDDDDDEDQVTTPLLSNVSYNTTATAAPAAAPTNTSSMSLPNPSKSSLLAAPRRRHPKYNSHTFHANPDATTTNLQHRKSHKRRRRKLSSGNKGEFHSNTNIGNNNNNNNTHNNNLHTSPIKATDALLKITASSEDHADSAKTAASSMVAKIASPSSCFDTLSSLPAASVASTLPCTSIIPSSMSDATTNNSSAKIRYALCGDTANKCCDTAKLVQSTLSAMKVVARVLVWTSVVAMAAGVVWYSYELKNNGTDPHLIAWFSAGAFVLLGFPISMFGIIAHLANYNQPNVQVYIVRILWMVPIYSVESWLCLRFHKYAIYIETLRDFYESYVLYSFLQFLIQVLGGEDALILLLKDKSPTRGVHMWGLQWCVKPWLMGQPVRKTYESIMPTNTTTASVVPISHHEMHTTNIDETSSTISRRRPLKRVHWKSPFFVHCKFGVLQYVLLKFVCAVVVMILERNNLYKEGDFTPKGGYLYICILTNVSQCWALYCLIFFYYATKNELTSIRPVGKFLSVKALVFFTWWQSVCISMLYQMDLIPTYQKVSSPLSHATGTKATTSSLPSLHENHFFSNGTNAFYAGTATGLLSEEAMLALDEHGGSSKMFPFSMSYNGTFHSASSFQSPMPEPNMNWTSEDVAKGMQDYLICIEMFLAAIVHIFVFPHGEYSPQAVEARTRALNQYSSSSSPPSSNSQQKQESARPNTYHSWNPKRLGRKWKWGGGAFLRNPQRRHEWDNRSGSHNSYGGWSSNNENTSIASISWSLEQQQLQQHQQMYSSSGIIQHQGISMCDSAEEEDLLMEHPLDRMANANSTGTSCTTGNGATTMFPYSSSRMIPLLTTTAANTATMSTINRPNHYDSYGKKSDMEPLLVGGESAHGTGATMLEPVQSEGSDEDNDDDDDNNSSSNHKKNNRTDLRVGGGYYPQEYEDEYYDDDDDDDDGDYTSSEDDVDEIGVTVVGANSILRHREEDDSNNKMSASYGDVELVPIRTSSSSHSQNTTNTVPQKRPNFVSAFLDSAIPQDLRDNTVGIIKGDYVVEKKTLLHHAATSDTYELFSRALPRKKHDQLSVHEQEESAIS